MKKFIITEGDKADIRKMYGLVNENLEMIKNELGDISVPVEEIVDSEDPLCTLPQTGNPEHDGILSKVWDWAQQQSVSTLRDTKKKIKEVLSKVKKGQMNEQAAPVLVIGTVGISMATLVIIGWILLVIIVLAIMYKVNKNQSPCKRRRKLVKKYGMDGYFM